MGKSAQRSWLVVAVLVSGIVGVSLAACVGDAPLVVVPGNDAATVDAAVDVSDAGVTPDAPGDAATADAEAGPPPCGLDGGGALDLTYANGAKPQNVGPVFFELSAASMDPLGRVALVGRMRCTGGSTYDVTAYRLNADGTKDTSFGELDAGARRCVDLGDPEEWARAAASDSSGGILIATGTGLDQTQGRVIRLLPSGARDLGYGVNGERAFPVGARIEAIHVDANNKLLVAYTNGGLGSLYRLAPDGSFDSSFGANGEVQLGTNQPFGVTATSTHVFVSGIDANGKAYVRRYTAAGSLDSTFNGTGTGVTIDPPGDAGALPMVGRAVVARGARPTVLALRTGNGGTPALLGWAADGGADPTFGSGGGVSLAPLVLGNDETRNPLAVQTCDGKILAGAYEPGLVVKFVRFDATGTLDPTFGSSGVVGPSFFNSKPIAILSDGTHAILVAATTGGNPLVARINL